MSDLNELFKVIAEGKKHYEENDPTGKKLKEVKEHARTDFDNIFSQLISMKEELETELHQLEAKKEEAIINEIATLVAEETLTEEVPPLKTTIQPEAIPTPEEKAVGVKYDVDKYFRNASFQQPEPDIVSKDIDDVRVKLKFLEQAIGKIAAHGPGSGAAEIYNLDLPTKTVTGDYTIGRKDYYIGVDHDVKCYITLPAIGSNVKNGRVVVIKDESGHAQLTPIKIVGTIDNDPNGAEIRVNNAAIQLLYSNGQWRII